MAKIFIELVTVTHLEEGHTQGSQESIPNLSFTWFNIVQTSKKCVTKKLFVVLNSVIDDKIQPAITSFTTGEIQQPCNSVSSKFLQADCKSK